MKLSSASIDVIIGRHPVASLASIGPGLKLHQVPIVFARHRDILWSSVDGKPKSSKELVRISNLRQNPHVSLLLDSYEQDWSSLWWVRIEGSARIIEAESESDPQVSDGVQALRIKYPQYQDVPVLRKPAIMIAINPVRINSWCASSEVEAMIRPGNQDNKGCN